MLDRYNLLWDIMDETRKALYMSKDSIIIRLMYHYKKTPPYNWTFTVLFNYPSTSWYQDWGDFCDFFLNLFDDADKGLHDILSLFAHLHIKQFLLREI